MKKILGVILGLTITVQALAQDANTIKFLGIPVDGKKTEVIQQLRKKGFTYDMKEDFLTGVFNGKESNVRVSENHGKVDRIFVADANTCSAAQIKVKFNNLIWQFRENDKYMEVEENTEIPANEDIGYEMLVHDKEYVASFYVNPIYGWTDDEKDMLVENIARQVKARADSGQYGDLTSDDMEQLLRQGVILKVLDMIQGQVWFKVAKFKSEYYICLYYDNLDNRPNGEDL